MAEVLTDPDDEIVFTDYHSPDDFSTIIEAISDTLTVKAKGLIRLLRVRPSLHRQIKSGERDMIEPVARNIAIRRSNPKNRWVLSTNPDMILVVKGEDHSLSRLVSNLADGFYTLPRFSLPECLWESAFKRDEPAEVIRFLDGQNLHLNTVVRRPGFLKYDNPGDFQLMLREDVLKIGGFDERMVNSWHVDSNLSKRMSLLKEVRSLEGDILAYHCNHALTPSFHTNFSNSWERFVKGVKTPYLNNPNWGLSQGLVEEIDLKNGHLRAVCSLANANQNQVNDVQISLETFNTLAYSLPHVFANLVDHLCYLPKNATLGYLGHNLTLVQKICAYLEQRKMSNRLLCLLQQAEDLPGRAQVCTLEDIISQPSVLIFDFGFDRDSFDGNSYEQGRKLQKQMIDLFIKVTGKNKRAAKYIGIHVLHTDADIIFSKCLDKFGNGYSSGISYGYMSKRRKGKRRSVPTFFQYLVVRFGFHYSDSIRRYLAKTRIGKRLFKSLV
ncbi:MAG: hypothetical protein COT85_05425 [Chlamydiae bacterium CG10_big_fil_rev_8_21_14_0_10_42_34]|nr:MAG: hypothetical protein COT85_05425 [Chlamydiae bacterium CG10_big_fil_rev_8_21_14_0_10_42_34]